MRGEGVIGEGVWLKRAYNLTKGSLCRFHRFRGPYTQLNVQGVGCGTNRLDN